MANEQVESTQGWRRLGVQVGASVATVVLSTLILGWVSGIKASWDTFRDLPVLLDRVASKEDLKAVQDALDALPDRISQERNTQLEELRQEFEQQARRIALQELRARARKEPREESP